MADSVVYKPSLPWDVRANDGEFGRCLAGVEDMVPGMVTGRLALAQALMREAITETGTNVVDPDYGYDLLQHLNGRVKAADLAEAATRLTARWKVDDRVQDVQVTVSLTNNVLVVAATVFDKEGPFPLTFSVSDAGAQLLAKV